MTARSEDEGDYDWDEGLFKSPFQLDHEEKIKHKKAIWYYLGEGMYRRYFQIDGKWVDDLTHAGNRVLWQ